MPVHLIFTMMYSVSLFCQVAALLAVVIKTGTISRRAGLVFGQAGLISCVFLFGAVLVPFDPVGFCIAVGATAYYIHYLTKFRGPRNRKKVRKLIGEKARAARDKLVAAIPGSVRVHPAGA